MLEHRSGEQHLSLWMKFTRQFSFLKMEAMWIPASKLHTIGFRRRSPHYWQSERRFGLPAHAYLSIFTAGENMEIGQQSLVEVNAFHVTFLLDVDNVHFYYHEFAENVWEPGGHTSSIEIERHGVEPRALRTDADRIAALVAVALQATLLERET